MAQLIESRYATALFELAYETGQIDRMEKEVVQLIEILEQEKEFMNVLQHPHLTQEEKVSLLEQVFDNHINKELKGLLVIMVRKNRQAHIQGVLSLFLEKIQEGKGIVTVKVISAIPLSQEQKNNLQKKLHTSLQKQVQLETEVDATLIGGLILQVGDKRIDQSLAGELKAFNQHLHTLQLV
ncbi:MAG: ATP synthase F1 subunit delta [Epulopiscium sp.]|nr:ATP synthase F1 subunit delta [Candidatus Epulonipiscium sp.]